MSVVALQASTHGRDALCMQCSQCSKGSLPVRCGLASFLCATVSWA